MSPIPRLDRRALSTASLIFILILCWLCLPAASAGRGALSRRTLSNGLTLIFERDDSSPLTMVSLAIKGGRRDNPQGLAGLSFLTTRLLLEIPDSRSAQVLMEQASSSGMSVQGDFSLITIESLSSYFEETLGLMSGPLLDPLFSGLRLDRAKESMLHQRQLSEDEPLQVGHAAQLRALFGESGYGASAYGSEDSLKAIKGKKVSEYYRDRFCSGNLVLVVSSDLAEDAVAAMIQKNLGSLRQGPAPSPLPLALPAEGPHRAYLAKSTNQTLISFAFRLPRLNPRSAALSFVAESVLGKGVASRLWPIRQKDMLAYRVEAEAGLFAEGGLLEVFLETDEAKKAAAAGRLKQVLTDVQQNGIGPEEFLAAKAIAKANILRDNETKDGRCPNLAFWEAVGLGADFLGRLPSEVDSLTLEEVNGFLRSTLEMGKASLVIVGPGDIPGFDPQPGLSSPEAQPALKH